MEPFQQRVIDEKAELDAKIDALESFMTTKVFRELDRAEQRRLFIQSSVMDAYSAILYDRICNFKVTE